MVAAILAAMRSDGPMQDERAGRVTRCANRLFRLVRDDVLDATGGRQQPFIYGSLTGRQEFFSRGGECREAGHSPASIIPPPLQLLLQQDILQEKIDDQSAKPSVFSSKVVLRTGQQMRHFRRYRRCLSGKFGHWTPPVEPEPHCGQVMNPRPGRARGCGARAACWRPRSRNGDPAGRCERLRGQRSTWRRWPAQCIRCWRRP
jgi:hypothetical protein